VINVVWKPHIVLACKRLMRWMTGFERCVASRVWDIETLECVRVLEGHNEAVLALAVGENFLVSGSYDTTVRFWDLNDLRCIR
jgi:WD40 repeat protein